MHRNGGFDLAIMDYSIALKFKPSYATAYYNRGVAHYDKNNLGEWEQAILDYTRALNLDSRYAVAYLNRGVIYLSQRREAQATTDFTQAVKFDQTLEPIVEKYLRARREPKFTDTPAELATR